jgi:hypothetical protein
MSQLSHIMNQLQIQRKQLQSELARLGAAINALRGLNTNGSSTIVVASRRHRLSAAGRKAISVAQKARWAKRAARSLAGVTKPKRTMSAASRKKIATAQKARWAAWKAKQKKAA